MLLMLTMFLPNNTKEYTTNNLKGVTNYKGLNP